MNQKLPGLTTNEARQRLNIYGRNLIPHKKPISGLSLVINQIKSPLIYILIIAALISFILGDIKDALVIIVAVLVNTVLGYYQERKAQKALFMLKSILSPSVKAYRDGKVVYIKAEEVVPGDLVLLAQGDKIPADGYILEQINIHINEAVLTGESLPVAKTEAIKEIYAKENSVFMGTTVISGRCKIIVTKTGLNTEFGKIASELSTTIEEATPLQVKLNILAKQLALLVGFLSLVIFILGIATGKNFTEMFTTSVALSVAAIPEGMAVSLTVILAIGMQRILKKKALVRKLVAAEALGSTTVIATDKTGTLTEGIMSVVKEKFTDSQIALKSMIFANNREEPMEMALWEYSQKKNIDPQKLEDSAKKLDEVSFEAFRRYMAVLVSENEKNTLYVKGAPEVIIEHSTLSKNDKIQWMQEVEKWATEGLRIIAFAYKPIIHKVTKNELTKEIRGVRFLGIVGITDPLRETVKNALQKTNKAGIKLKVITGDYAVTSISVLKNLGVAITGDQILEGDEIEKLSQKELEDKVNKISLYARVTPIQKLRIVQALQKNGEVVALIGDGVNDAPAIKASNIGIVVSGASDVARETADMVLLDSNFNTIIDAVEEGRGIYENIKKVILYLLSDSFSEIILVFGALLLGLPLPLLSAQILWINVVTDGLPNLALTVDPQTKNLLNKPPIDPKSSLLDKTMITLIIIITTVTGIISLLIYIFTLKNTADLVLARTILFTSLGIDSLIYVFSVRTLDKPIFKINFFSNYWLLLSVLIGFFLQLLPLYSRIFRGFLETKPLYLNHWILVLTGPVLMIILIEVIKFISIKTKSSGY